MGKVRTEMSAEQIRLRKKIREREAKRLLEQKEQIEAGAQPDAEVDVEDITQRLDELEELMTAESKTEEEKNKRRFQVVVKGKAEDPAEVPKKNDGKWGGQGAKSFMPSGSTVTTEDVETPTGKEAQKLQALIGNAKAETTVAIGNREGVEEVLGEDQVSKLSTVVFQNCKDCTFTLSTMITKIYVQQCSNVTVHVQGRVLTQMCELFRCDNITLTSDVRIKTVQADLVDGLNLSFSNRAHFQSVIWAGCQRVQVDVAADDTFDAETLSTGFDELAQEFDNLVFERSQFKVHLVRNHLHNDELIRLPNGFPTTRRERDEFERKQEEKIQAIAKRAGIRIHQKDDFGKKVGRNQPCECGSGRKFKKCCGAN